MKSITFQQLKDYSSLKDLMCDMPSVCVVDSSGEYILASQSEYYDFMGMPDLDKMFIKKVALFAVQEQTISASAIQRKFKVGYARACHILDYMENAGYISSANGIEPRKVFATQEQIEKDFL